MVCHRPVLGSFLWATSLDSCRVLLGLAVVDSAAVNICARRFVWAVVSFLRVRASQWDCWSHLNSVQLLEQLSNTS